MNDKNDTPQNLDIDANNTQTIESTNLPENLHEQELTELEQAQSMAVEYQDSWLRAKADLENLRRRHIEDLEKTRKFCLESFAESLLPVMDSLQAALKDSNINDSIKSGVELTLKQLQSSFDKYKIVALDPQNEILNPAYHQAVTTQASQLPVNTILQVMQKGYTISERLIRPALVIVSNGESTNN